MCCFILGTRSERGLKMRLNDLKLSENFNLKEFECPCCHTVSLHPLLLLRLQNLRGEWGRPIIINSGYRCEIHNRAVGGVMRSHHRIGQAADVRVTAKEQERFCELAARHGFGKIISYPTRNFIHLQLKGEDL